MQSEIIDMLYRKYYHSSYLYIFSLCKNKEIAEDIVSQAFEKAYLSLDDEKHGFQYWLLVVCKNLWLDYLRKNKKVMQNKDEDCEYVSPTPTPELEYIKKEQSRIIYECLLLLPSKYREILSLHYYSNIPLTEISIIMGLTNSNAKTLVHRARAKLKNILEEYEYEF